MSSTAHTRPIATLTVVGVTCIVPHRRQMGWGGEGRGGGVGMARDSHVLHAAAMKDAGGGRAFAPFPPPSPPRRCASCFTDTWCTRARRTASRTYTCTPHARRHRQGRRSIGERPHPGGQEQVGIQGGRSEGKDRRAASTIRFPARRTVSWWKREGRGDLTKPSAPDSLRHGQHALRRALQAQHPPPPPPYSTACCAFPPLPPPPPPGGGGGADPPPPPGGGGGGGGGVAL
jgi:hypothetical protein